MPTEASVEAAISPPQLRGNQPRQDAIGSVGAVQHLTGVFPELYDGVGDKPWSGVIASQHDGATIVATSWTREPRTF